MDVKQSSIDTPLRKKLAHIGRMISYLSLGICGVISICLVFFIKDFIQILYIVIAALAVVIIAEGLPAIVTIALKRGAQRLDKRNVFVRKLNSVEALSYTDILCIDKTRLLTKGELTVKTLYYGDHLYEISGEGYETQGEFRDQHHRLNKLPFTHLLEAGVYCNNAFLEENNISGDPTEIALLVSAAKASLKTDMVQRITEIPFSNEHKTMSVLVQKDGAYYVYMKGKPEAVLNHCYRFVTASKEEPIVTRDKKEILTINDNLAIQSLQTIGFAYKKLSKREFENYQENHQELERGLTFLGIQAMTDARRSGVKDLIKKCLILGIRVIMITEDHPHAASTFAKEIGIESSVLTGNDVEMMDQKTLRQTVKSVSVYAHITPNTKLKIVTALQQNDHIVAVTGNEVTDAPALKKADIGIAMGVTGTDSAKEASAMVLLDERFLTIVDAIEESRAVFRLLSRLIKR